MLDYDLYIFDVDGTLLDTSAGIISATRYAISACGLDMPDDGVLRSFIGPPVQDSFARVFGLDKPRADECAAVFRDRYKNVTLLEAQPYPGIFELIDRINSLGKKCAIATYKREDYAMLLLRHFGFDRVVGSIHGADMAGRLKKLDLIELCIAEGGVTDRSRVVMVGDTEHDGKAALQAGVDFLAVTYGFGYTPGNVPEYAACSADSVNDIIRMI